MRTQFSDKTFPFLTKRKYIIIVEKEFLQKSWGFGFQKIAILIVPIYIKVECAQIRAQYPSQEKSSDNKSVLLLCILFNLFLLVIYNRYYLDIEYPHIHIP